MSRPGGVVSSDVVEAAASADVLERLSRIEHGDPRGRVRLALVLSLATWLPLVLLALLQGVALPGTVKQPFFQDITPHVRFLFALPLLVIAEVVIGPRLVEVGSQFVASALVTDADLPRFEAIVASAVKLRESRLTELLLLAVAYLTTATVIGRELGTDISPSWLGGMGPSGIHLTLTGWFYVAVSVPIYQFILFRWLLRLMHWAGFMFRMSSLDLKLLPTHADRMAGLGFIGEAIPPTSLVVLAGSSVLSSAILTQVLYWGAKPKELIVGFAAFVVTVLLAFLAPFLVFTPKLILAKRNGLKAYRALATRYAQSFDSKWVSGAAEPSEPLLGSQDIQSLADMGNNFDRVKSMKVFPIGPSDLWEILLAMLLPGIFILFTQVSLEEVIHMLLKLVL
jgi:hypothetical protein